MFNFQLLGYGLLLSLGISKKNSKKNNYNLNEINILDLNFERIYLEEIYPIQVQNEHERHKLLISLAFSIRIILIAAMLTIMLCIQTNFISYVAPFLFIRFSYEKTILMLIGIYLIIYTFTILYYSTLYDKINKEILIKKILNHIPNSKYSPDANKMNLDNINDSRLLSEHIYYKNFYVKDYYFIPYKDINIEMSEITCLNDSRYNFIFPIFKGLTINLDCPKEFDGQTLIMNKKRTFFKIKFLNKKIEKVQFEDIKFNQIFTVFSTNQITARYLITTSFMERLLKLSMLFDSKTINYKNINLNKFKSLNIKIKISFKNNKILFLITTNQHFLEIGTIFDYTITKSHIYKFLLDLKLITEIIDILKLDQNIGL